MKYSFLFFFFFLLGVIQLHGQSKVASFDKFVTVKKKTSKEYSFLKPLKLDNNQSYKSSVMFKPILHSDMAVFCRLEHAVMKDSNMNIKFRLGSVSYVDKMEGKIK